MKEKKLTTKLLTVLSIFLIISSCSKKEESPNPIGNNYTNNPTVPENKYIPPAVTFTTTVSGFVQDINGNPIQNAVVSTGNKTFTTDENGAFELIDAPFTGDFCYIKAQKSDYFTASTTIHGQAGSSYTTQLIMTAQKGLQSFNAAEAKTITLPSGAKVDFPANAIKRLDGTPYTGKVFVATEHINPADPNFSLLIPGGDLRAFGAEGNEVQLFSYGMLNVEIRDASGSYLQLAEGKKATLTMPVPANMQSKAPAIIPLWYFDENKGIWIEEGEAKLQNGIYTGEVSHFTPWNCDWRGPRAFLKGILVDCEGEILPNTRVNVGQITISTNENGEWKCWVPAGIEIEIGSYNSSWRTNGSIIIKAPILTEGQEYNIGKVSTKCQAKVKAKIKDCDNNPFNGYAILKVNTNEIRVQIKNGNFNIEIFQNMGENASLAFFQPQKGQLTFTDIVLPVSENKLDLGDITACPPKTVTPELSFDYDAGNGKVSVAFDDIKNAEATYYKNQDILRINFVNGIQQANYKSFSLEIMSPKLGNVSSTLDSGVNIFLSQDGSFTDENKMNFNLQKYESEGGEISGVFSGQMQLYDGTVKSAAITNGKFKVLRLPNK